jgi:hypothetical protein
LEWLAALECGAQIRVEVMRRGRLLCGAAARANVRHDGLGGLEQVRALRLQGFEVGIALAVIQLVLFDGCPRQAQVARACLMCVGVEVGASA